MLINRQYFQTDCENRKSLLNKDLRRQFTNQQGLLLLLLNLYKFLGEENEVRM